MFILQGIPVNRLRDLFMLLVDRRLALPAVVQALVHDGLR